MFAFSAAVTILVALEKPADLPEQGPDAFTEAFPHQAGDTNINDVVTWLNTVDGTDTVPDVRDSPSLTAFVHELPDLSEYVAKGGCPEERVVVAGLGDSEDTVPDVLDIPNLTTSPNKLPDLSEYRAEGGCSKERAVAVMLRDSEDTVPDVLSIAAIPNVPHSTAFLNQLPDFSEYGAEGDCPEDRVAAAMLGDADPSLGRWRRPPCWTPKGSRAGGRWCSPPSCQGVLGTLLRRVLGRLQRRVL